MLKVNDSRKNHAGGVRLSRKLSVSNIIWEKDKNNFNKFLVGLKKNNIDAVELALNCLWDEPTVIKESDINWLKKIIYEYELEISALHALTYTRADLNFFRDKESFNDACSYLLKYVDIADKLGVQHLVLGSPSLRVMHEKSYSDCQLLFHEFLDKFDNYSDSIFLNIEPLPENICEFINTISEAADYADEYQLVNIQLDTRVLIEQGYKFVPEGNKYFHCQVGNPGMFLHEDAYDGNHLNYSKNLYDYNYSGYISAEVLCPRQYSSSQYLEMVSSKLKYLYG